MSFGKQIGGIMLIVKSSDKPPIDPRMYRNATYIPALPKGTKVLYRQIVVSGILVKADDTTPKVIHEED